MKSIKGLKEFYEKGHIVLNPLVLERFKEHISEKTLLEALG